MKKQIENVINLVVEKIYFLFLSHAGGTARGLAHFYQSRRLICLSGDSKSSLANRAVKKKLNKNIYMNHYYHSVSLSYHRS